MAKVFLVKGIPSSGKTQYILNKVAEAHRENPFSYLALGPSGSFIRYLRERFLTLAGSFFNDSFLLLDQYVVQFLQNRNDGLFYINRSFLAGFVAGKVREGHRLYPLLQKGQGMIDAFMQFYTWLKDHDAEKLLKDIEQTEDTLLKEFAGLYRTIDTQLREKRLFTVEDAYYRFLGLIEQKAVQSQEIPYRRLFLDGFFDLTPKTRRFFYAFFSFFEEVFLSVPLNPDSSLMDASFETFETGPSDNQTASPLRCLHRWETISLKTTLGEPPDSLKTALNLLGKNPSPMGISTQAAASCSKSIGAPFEIKECANPHQEAIFVCNWVKQLLKDKEYCPEDVGVVVRDERKYLSLLREGFSENGVPFRFEGDLPLNRSLNVNKLLLPFRAFSGGFSPDSLLALLETGFVAMNESLPFPEFEALAMRAKLAYSGAFHNDTPVSLEQRKGDWNERLTQYRKLLERKKQGANALDDDGETYQQVEQEQNRLQFANESIQRLFVKLSFFEPKKAPTSKEGYIRYFQDLYEGYGNRGLLSDTEEEQNATHVFLNEVLPELNRFLYAIDPTDDGSKLVSQRQYWKYLKLFVDLSGYRQSVRIDNRVYLSNLEDARFREKKVKVFVGMTDQNYPLLASGSVFMRAQWPKEQGELPNGSFRDYIVQKERRDFMNAVRSSGDFVLFTYPKADISGNTYLPSLFLKPFLRWAEKRKVMGRERDPLLRVAVGDPANYSLRQFAVETIAKGKKPSLEVLETLKGAGIDWERIRPTRPGSVSSPLENTRYTQTLSELFGKTFSASKHTTLLECPRKFLYRHIMKLYRPLRVFYGFDYLTEGVIFHNTLKNIFSDEKTRNRMDNAEAFKTTVEVMLRKEIETRMYASSALLESVETAYFTEVMARFAQTYPERIESLTNRILKRYPDLETAVPSLFEVPFTENAAVPFHQKPDGSPIYLIGKIDRVDILPDNRAVIIDYKRTIPNNGAEQLLLYAWALERLENRKVAAISLLQILSKPKGAIKKAEIKTLVSQSETPNVFDDPTSRRIKSKDRDQVVEEARKAIDRALRGDFTKNASLCRQCEYASICRFRSNETGTLEQEGEGNP
ncbi:MAG TPA: PD-(D/E)XK nuclease family protein [Thermotogota bacterium]|nr:PD-(D/E)XK nuclease family protein [Thermotogota bacterium]